MDDLIQEFLVESNENLDRLDSELVKLETDPSSQELLSSIFRTIHTIKGTCGFLAFTTLERISHQAEYPMRRVAAHVCETGKSTKPVEVALWIPPTKNPVGVDREA